MYHYEAEVIRCDEVPTLVIKEHFAYRRAFVGIDLGFGVWKHMWIYLDKYVEPVSGLGPSRILIKVKKRDDYYLGEVN